MVGKSILRGGGGKRAFGGQKYTKYNKINNNSENFRGQVAARKASPPGLPLVAGLFNLKKTECVIFYHESKT